MGARDLKEILEARDVRLEELRGKLAVDAFNALYQFLSIIRGPDGTPLMDSQGRITSHLSGLFYRTCSLLEKGVQPAYVFDGKPSELKKKTIAERVEKKAEAEELMRKALKEGRVEEAARLAQRTARLTKEMAGESQELLKALGLPVVQAPSEGEAECARMASDGVVRATASQDFDALLFGSPVLVRNLSFAGRRRLPKGRGFVDVEPEQYFLKENLERLGLSRQQLVWIGLLCGTDFNKGVHGIGPKKGLKLVKESKSLKDIAKATKTEFKDLQEVEKLFLKPDTKKVKEKELEFKEPDPEAVVRLLCDERDFAPERVQAALAKAFNQPLDAKQGTLKRWF